MSPLSARPSSATVGSDPAPEMLSHWTSSSSAHGWTRSQWDKLHPSCPSASGLQCQCRQLGHLRERRANQGDTIRNKECFSLQSFAPEQLCVLCCLAKMYSGQHNKLPLFWQMYASQRNSKTIKRYVNFLNKHNSPDLKKICRYVWRFLSPYMVQVISAISSFIERKYSLRQSKFHPLQKVLAFSNLIWEYQRKLLCGVWINNKKKNLLQNVCIFQETDAWPFQIKRQLFCWVDQARVKLDVHWLCEVEANIGMKPYCIQYSSMWARLCALPDISPTRSMRSHPEKASLMLCTRATVDCLLFLVIWIDRDKNILIINYLASLLCHLWSSVSEVNKK